jgi:hypothetical protein
MARAVSVENLRTPRDSVLVDRACDYVTVWLLLRLALVVNNAAGPGTGTYGTKQQAARDDVDGAGQTAPSNRADEKGPGQRTAIPVPSICSVNKCSARCTVSPAMCAVKIL